MGASAALTGPWIFFLEDFEGLGGEGLWVVMENPPNN